MLYANNSQAMNSKELSYHIENHNNRTARMLILTHSQATLNNPRLFSDSLPLNTAISNENTEIIPDLIEAGADPNRCDKTGSPLQIAAQRGNVYVMELLAQRGAKFDQEIIDIAMNAVDKQRHRLLWPGVEFKRDGDNTPEERVQTVKEKILELAQQTKV